MTATAVDNKRQLATALAPGKINLTLHVMGKREDDYHELRSLVIGVGLSDRVTCRHNSIQGVELHCDDPSLMGRDNLAVRAAEHLAAECGCPADVVIELHKRIPVGGGMGGGSSDAATVLRLCNHLWQTGCDNAELARIGAVLGSDVPLFFSMPSAVMTGRGELVEAVRLSWRGWVLLVFVDTVVSTAQVYQQWRATDRATDRANRGADATVATDAADAVAECLQAESASALMAAATNDLEQAVFRVAPKVGEIREAIQQAGITPMRVCGAGSTLFTLFDDEHDAKDAEQIIRGLGVGIETAIVAAPVGQDSINNEET